MTIKKILSIVKTYINHRISENIPYTTGIRAFSEEIRSKSNITLFDSLHLASAYISEVDVFLSTDDKLIKAWNRLDYDLQVTNPTLWFMG